MDQQSDERAQDVLEAATVNTGQGRDVVDDDDDDDEEEPFFQHEGYVSHSTLLCLHRCLMTSYGILDVSYGMLDVSWLYMLRWMCHGFI